MKKMICVTLVLATLLTLAVSVASAANGDVHSPFDYVDIRCAANAEVRLNKYEPGVKSAKPDVLYIRHYLVYDYGSVYNNHFRAQNFISGAIVGSDWMAPDTANYVRSSAIDLYQRYWAMGRGNTDYGLTTITITGYSDSNH